MPEEASEWILVGLDAKVASKRGVPARIPVPAAELETMGEKGMTIDAIRGWITRFMSTAPGMHVPAWRSENAALVKSFEAFVGKKDAWAKAQDAFNRRDFKSAIGTLRMIAAIDPGDHAARLNLAGAMASDGDNAGALAQLEAIASTWGDEADFHVTRANVLLSLDRKDDATNALVDALERDSGYRPALDALVKLGVLVSVYEDPRDAASLTYVRADSVGDHLEGVWDAAPRDVAYYLDQATYHEMERRPEVVLAAADRAIALGGDAPSPLAVSAKLGALRALGRNDEAMALAEATAARAPSAQAYVDLARCQLEANRAGDAKATLDRAIALDPGDLPALDLRWWPAERHDLALLEPAAEQLKAHAEAHPGSPGAWRMLARARLALGDGDGAMPLFERAVSLAPEDDDARTEWWGELLRRGQPDEVLKDAAKVADMGKRSWKLRWNEAEAYAAAKRTMEAQAAFAAINHDTSLHLDVRKRAKRAAMARAGEKR